MELTPLQMDILQELINIGVGRAAGMLNRLVNAHIQLQVPELRVLTPKELTALYDAKGRILFSAVQLTFSGEFSGISALIFPPESAATLASLVLGKEGLPNGDEALRTGTLQEVGNIVLNGVMGSISNILKEPLTFSTPNYLTGSLENIVSLPGKGQGMILVARTHFSMKEHLVEGEVLILFSLSSFGSLLAAIDAMAAA